MRWFVYLLVAANFGVFLWFSLSEPEGVRSVEEGRLPRVSEIELIDQQSARAPEVPPGLTSESESSGQNGEKFVEEVGDIESAIDPERALNVASPPQCFAVGWFDERDKAADYRQAVSLSGSEWVVEKIAERAEPREPFHWVIVPPLESRELALARYRELVALGVEAYVVPSGERENAISLGLFRSLRSAEAVLQRRQEQNISAILVKFPRNRISYALVFEGVPPESLSDLGGASAQSEPGLQLIEFSDCEGVATAEKNP